MAIPLRLEAYDVSGLQHEMHGRNLRLAKAWQGGEDMWLSFDLDREIRIDYPDVAYGNDVILRRGLTAVWAGEQRQIEQREEVITVNCLGRWVHADDWNYDGQGRLWCESRYKMWNEVTPYHASTYQAGKYTFSTADQLFIAPRKGENFLNVGYYGGLQYYCPYDEIERVSFDYDLLDPGNWELHFLVTSGTPGNWGVESVYWTAAATGSGVKDIALPAGPAGRQHLLFRMIYNAGSAQYTGETGVSCYGRITNLRLWGQATESPCMIHVTEDIVDAIQAATPISADQVLLQEQLFVRDSFTDPNGTLLANHQPDIDKERGGWSILQGGFDIQGNEANNTAASSDAVIDPDISDGVVCCDCDTTAFSGGLGITGIIFRAVDLNNHWAWRLQRTGALELWRIVGGAPAVIWSGAVGIQDGYTYHLMVRLRGDEIQGYVGGILRHTRNDTTFQTATEHGLTTRHRTGFRFDNFEVYEALPIWPMFYEDGESCYDAAKDVDSFGDWDHKAIGWGVEAGGDRLYLRQANRETVRYVVPKEYIERVSARGDTHREFYSEAWARYIDEEGMRQWTAKYYVHVTNAGLVVNTTATGDDLASVVYGVQRDTTKDFGRVDANLAVEYLIQYLMEHGHPQVKSSYVMRGRVKDLHRGGAWIDPVEMEMGYLVQIPQFRAAEAEGVAGSDLRDWDTTFLLVGMEFDGERGSARLIPEGATEDLKRIIAYARAFQAEEDRKHISKRSEVIGG